uniref:Transposon Ty3-I Gag-Pol polyprotein n=1 Tax=Tanacetum cinerariifolium TaxID=118510 RepID=A0A6L2LAR9_TANCI|nr:transposon Ty3-I Gag-Pol polyprotein [Tanacetum cinerariifolium]
MVTDLEDSKTHNVGGVWSREYMDNGFTKFMSELDRCYTMLQELCFVIIDGALIHKNHEGSKHEGLRINPTIDDFGGNYASNQSSFNNRRIEEWEEEKKEDRVPTTKIFCSKILINNLVNAVRDWSLLKILPEVRNSKVANVFQEEDELEYAETLDKKAKQVTYVIKQTLCSPKALVKDFKFRTEPHPSAFYIGRIKKGLTLKVTEICKVPLAMRNHYNELVTCDVIDIETCHVLLGRPWKETGVSYALVMKGVEDVMENAIPAVIKPLLAKFGKIVTNDAPDALSPLRNIHHQIDLSRKNTLLVSIRNEVLGFDSIKELYASDEDFGNIWMELETKQHRIRKDASSTCVICFYINAEEFKLADHGEPVNHRVALSVLKTDE